MAEPAGGGESRGGRNGVNGGGGQDGGPPGGALLVPVGLLYQERSAALELVDQEAAFEARLVRVG